MIRFEPRKSLLVLLATAALSVPIAQAQTPSLLQQLSDETHRVYEQVRVGMVHVALPTPQWLEQINEQEKLLRKWGNQLNPEALDALRREQQRLMGEQVRHVGAVVPTTQSSPRESPTTQASGGQGLHFPPPAEDPGSIVLVATGLLVDTDGHVVLPMYVERQVVGNTPLRVRMGDGQLTSVRFVGSDAQTKLTVLQLENHTGKPVSLAANRPDDGVLTLVVDRQGAAHLAVWTNQHPEPGLIVMPDGSIAGFGLNGRFLPADDAKPIIDQIIATGEVRRAVLGVSVREVSKDAPLRQQLPTLGAKPAFLIEAIDPGSAAERGGMRPGDLILAVAGEPVGDATTFAKVIAMRNGRTMFSILRNGETVDLAIELQAKPN